MNKIAGEASSESSLTKWILVGLLSHSAWGAYPVLARYLQNTHHIGTLSLGVMTNSLASIVILVLMAPKIKFMKMGFKETAILVFVMVSRSLSNLYASRFTYASTVQLISLLAPFLVAYLSKTLLKEALPKRTGTALCLSLFGSILMIAGAMGGAAKFGAATQSDWIGIGLAIFSGTMLAAYLLVIKDIGKRGSTAETLALIQFASLCLFNLMASILSGEDWSPWLSLKASGIVAYFAFALGVILLGTIFQNHAIRNLGAAPYSTFQAMRLLSSIALSWIILGERLTSLWQVAGTVIVMATVTWYTLLQKKERSDAGIAQAGNIP